MSIDHRRFAVIDRHRASGVALVVTLALLVLVTVAVVAFLSRSTTNLQISSNSDNGVAVDVYSSGAASAIIANLQSEMLAGSFAAPAPTPATPATLGAPYIMPLTNSFAVSPSRSLRIDSNNQLGLKVPGTDPNAAYFQFANLVKQSANGIPTYTVPAAPGSNGNTVTGPIIASDIITWKPNPDGRFYDGNFWAQPRLASVPVTGQNGMTDLEPLIPYWVYTDRTGTPVVSENLTDRIATGTLLNPKNVVGRYAYNIYNIGGTLNANVVGNGLPQNTAPALGSGTSPGANEIVPGYKGSSLTADLSGLTLNGALQISGTAVTPPANWQQLPTWRANGAWGTNSTTYTGFAYVLAGGQFSGWLNDFFQPFDPLLDTFPPGANYLTNNRFASRQDLISWVNKYWGNNSDTTGKTTWMLPYLTHFSYDTDAPTFSPEPSRPHVIQGENDAYKYDDLVNEPFVGPLAPLVNNPPRTTDANGNPLVKRRFPLSALSLISNCGPATPFKDNGTLGAQIRYDFGLVWSNDLVDAQTGEKSPGWVYQDVGSAQPPIRIKQLGDVASEDRSPNFFELLKAAITIGSLGKQYGNPYDPNDTANLVSDKSRFGITANQIIQIGANIISQTSTNYTPTHIQFNSTLDVYGVQDFPYLYRSREMPYLLEAFTGSDMQVKVPVNPPPHSGLSATNAALAVRVIQTELWNPHAPNRVATPLSRNPAVNYPISFRVVPTQVVASYSTGASGATAWTKAPGGIGSGITDYRPAGGIRCDPGISYPQLAATDASQAPYLTFPVVPPNADSAGGGLGTFREPCALLSANVPPGLTPHGATTPRISSFNGMPSTIPTSSVNLAPYGTNGIPTVYPAERLNGKGEQICGFNMGYYCAGPDGGTFPKWLTIDQQYGGAPNGTIPGGMSLSLQYSVNGGPYYTYDVADSAGPYTQHLNNINYRLQFEQGTRTDPRTHRWGFMWATRANGYAWDDYTKNEFPAETAASGYTGFPTLTGLINTPVTGLIGANPGSQPPQLPTWFGSYSSGNPALGYAQTNQSINLPAQEQGSANSKVSSTYYQDPDGVVRLADGAYTNYAETSTNPPLVNGNTIGLPMLMPTTSVSGSSVQGPVSNLNSRPVILNRPFQSVAELGYVFRDTPWKSLDFFTPQSGDNALLDVFTAYGPDPWSYAYSSSTPAANNPANTNIPTSFHNEMGLVTGHVDLNTAQAPVLAALIQGTLINTPITNPTPPLMIDASSNVAAKVANALVSWTHNQRNADQGPLRNRAELVGKWVPSRSYYAGFSYGDVNNPAAQLTTMLMPLGQETTIIKQQRECIVRALSDVGTTRTWNLLVDVVAQTGRLTNTATTLKDFVVSGEKHQWVSVAIDRVTGKVIKMQAEPVRS